MCLKQPFHAVLTYEDYIARAFDDVHLHLLSVN